MAWRTTSRLKLPLVERGTSSFVCSRSVPSLTSTRWVVIVFSQDSDSSADVHVQDEDPEEFYSNSGIPWRLSKTEYNSLLDQRM